MNEVTALNGKTIILVRHAKSSWDDFSIKDFDRPLNDRGKRDAPVMAQRLLKRGVTIDAFISSPAKRAKKTSEIFAQAYNQGKDSIHFIEELYLASPATFYEVISNLDDRFHTVAIFSHNNGLSEFANMQGVARVDDIPTCGIFAVKSDATTWKDYKTAAKGFWFFDAPKLPAKE